jgi:hypothetical protein
LRYNTIIGALRVDFGFKLYDPYPNTYPPGTLGTNKSSETVLAIPSNAPPGLWLWSRKVQLQYLGDVMSIKFAIGQAF